MGDATFVYVYLIVISGGHVKYHRSLSATNLESAWYCFKPQNLTEEVGVDGWVNNRRNLCLLPTVNIVFF